MKGSGVMAAALLAAMGLGAVGAGAAWASAPMVAPLDLPSVADLTVKAETAVGGRAALDKIKTLRTVMMMDMAGQKVTMESSWSRKGGRLMAMKTSMGDMLQGSDGTTAWRKTPMGYQLADAEQIGQAGMHMSMIDPTCRTKEDMEGAEVVGKESFKGRDCYKLKYVKKGKPGFVFFDAETGLPAGSEQESERGKSTVTYGDWKDVNGVKFFHSVKFESAGGASARQRPGEMNGEATVEKIEANAVEESAFVLPDEVKALAAGREKEDDAPAPAAGAAEIKLSDLSEKDQKEVTRTMAGLANMDTAMLKQMRPGMEAASQQMPGDKKIKYLLQEINREITKRGR